MTPALSDTGVSSAVVSHSLEDVLKLTPMGSCLWTWAAAMGLGICDSEKPPVGLTPSRAGVLWCLLNALVGGQWLSDPYRPPKAPEYPEGQAVLATWGELGGTKAGLRPAAGDQRMVFKPDLLKA